MDFEDNGEYYRLVGFSTYPEPVKPEEPDDPYGFAKEVEPEEMTRREAYARTMRRLDRDFEWRLRDD